LPPNDKFKHIVMGTFQRVHKRAAGIDIGSDKVFVSPDGVEVKVYNTFTDSLQQCSKDLKSWGIRTVAMEATGVYWVVLYDILEQDGFNVWLVNGAEVKNLPGRKTDTKDCQWIQQLHSHGLLKRCFIPHEEIRELRSYMRIRDDHVQMASAHIFHIQKAYTQMGIRLHQVISDTLGATGIRLLEAILAGKRDPEILVQLCDIRILKKKKDDVVRSLRGNYKEEHLFAMRQAYQCWQFYQKQIQECDLKISALLDKLNQGKPTARVDHGKTIKHKKTSIPGLDEKLVQFTGGRNAIRLPGISEYTFLQLLSEIGSDMSRWKSPKEFVSWLRLAPRMDRSGKSAKRRKDDSIPKAGQLFKHVSQTLLQSKHNALGEFARRLRARKGPAIAIKAVARKMACMYYHIMSQGIEYVEVGIERYKEQQKRQQMKYLFKKAAELNLTITPLTT
jgi:transposase